MSVKLKKKDIYSFFCIFLIFMYSFTKAGIHNYIYINSLVCYFSFFLIVFFALLIGKSFLRKKYNSTEVLLIFCALVVLCNRNNNFVNGDYEDGLSFVTIVLFFVVASKTNCWHKYVIPIMVIWISLHSVFTILEYAIPGFYMDYIINLMPEYSYMHLSSVYKLGYMPGLAVHYSTNGMYLAVSLITVSISFLYKKTKNNVFGFISTVFVAIALLLTGKRALIIFPTISFVFVYYLLNCNKPISRFGKLIVLLTSGSVLFYIGCKFIPSLSNFIYRFVQTKEAGDISLGRFETSSLAFDYFKSSIVFGNGWDSFKYYHDSMFGIKVNVHNIYLQLLCENGILGSLPFFSFFILSFYRAIRGFVCYRKNYTDIYPKNEFFLGLSIAMQCFFLLYGLTGNPLYDQQVFYPYIVCISASEYYVYDINVKKIGGKVWI